MLDEVREVLEGRRRWAVVEADSLLALRDLPGECVDGVLCDPPYSSGGQFRGDRSGSTASKYVGTDVEEVPPDFAGDTRDQRGFVAWTALWSAEALRVAREGSPGSLFSDWRQVPSTTDGFQAGGWLWRGLWVWDKTEGVRPVMGRFRAQCEFAVWGSKGPMPLERGVGVLAGVARCSPRGDGRDEKYHQAGKPASMLRELVRIVVPGGVVLDPFAGSGSMGVAALREGRRYIGIEILPHWADLTRRRLAAEEAGVSLADVDAGQGALFGGGA